MAFDIEFRSLTQTPPITATQATVKVEFNVLGAKKPDIVQVYALDAASTRGLGDLVDEVDITIKDFQYVSALTLRAGTIYTIFLCARTKTGDMLDPDIDGKSFELFCLRQQITTQALQQPGLDYTPPVITHLDPEPATLKQDNRITVTWSSVKYEKFLVWWITSGGSWQQVDVDSGTTWTLTGTVPKVAYTFGVKGGHYTGLSGFKYSDLGPTATISAIPNVTSLRQFLAISGINPSAQGLRSLTSPQASLRKFMKL